MHITLYGLMMVSGFLGAAVMSMLLARFRYHVDVDDTIYILTFTCIGVLAGAKLLYLAVSLPEAVSLIQAGQWKALLAGGMVFYGGLLGGLAGAALITRYFWLDPWEYIPAILPGGVLIAGMGRIGCTMAGCCHGRIWSFGIVYHHSLIAPNGVTLFPTQPMEACFDFLLVILLIYLGKKISGQALLWTYLLSYSTFRFFLEFIRGDEVRGFFLCFSTSQWISLGIISVFMISMVRKKVDNVYGIEQI